MTTRAWPDPIPLLYRRCIRCGIDVTPARHRRRCLDCHHVELLDKTA